MVGRSDLRETGPGVTAESGSIVGRATNLEVNVIESVQELAAHFKVRSFRELDLLDDAQVRPDKARAGQDDVALAARCARIVFDAVAVVGGRNEPAFRRTESIGSNIIGVPKIKGSAGIDNNVIREVIDQTTGF